MEKNIPKEVPLPDVEKKEGEITSNRRNFIKYGLAALGLTVLGEEVAIGAIRNYLSGGGASEAPISLAGTENQAVESYIEETMFHNYKNVGPTKSLDGKVRVERNIEDPENVFIHDEGMIYPGKTPYLSLAVSPDGKKGYIFANKAAFDSGRGDLNIEIIEARAHENIPLELFKKIGDDVYGYELDFEVMLKKYGLDRVILNVRTTDLDNTEWKNPTAISEFVIG